jgi:hypothetical protein
MDPTGGGDFSAELLVILGFLARSLEALIGKMFYKRSEHQFSEEDRNKIEAINEFLLVNRKDIDESFDILDKVDDYIQKKRGGR